MTNIIKTEHLAIRKLTHDDFETLLAIMGKPEVMYTQEHSFNKIADKPEQSNSLYDTQKTVSDILQQS